MFNLQTLNNDLKKIKSGNSFGGSRTLKDYTPRRRIINENPCSICHSEIYIGDIQHGYALYTPCHHLFHRDCLCPWLMRNQTCPICRNPFSRHQVNTMCPPATYGQPTIKRKVLGERRNNIDIYGGPGRNAVSIDWDGNIITR